MLLLEIITGIPVGHADKVKLVPLKRSARITESLLGIK